MTTATTTRTIQCTVQGMTTKNGRNGDYLVLEILRPKMKFPEKYNAWEPAAFKEVATGDTINLTLERERVKDDKADDGQVTSYWWKALGINPHGPDPAPIAADPDWDALNPRAQEPERVPINGEKDWDAINAEKAKATAAKDQNIQMGAATRDAMIFIQMDVWPIPEGRTPTSWLRECRARLYYNVHAHAMEPQFWCYEHNKATNKGSNGYGHPVDGGSCIWEQGVVLEK